MAHSIKILPKADKGIDALPADTKKRVLKAIKKLALDPRPTGCKKLKGEDVYRIRVGTYRVIYEVHDNVLVVIVLKVGHRQSVYRD